MRTSARRANCHSMAATSTLAESGPPAANANDSSRSVEAKRVLFKRNRSAGNGAAVNGSELVYHGGWTPMLAPYAYTPRIPHVSRPSIAASVCSELVAMCDQSRIVVTPELRADSEDSKLPRKTSSG